MATFHLWGSPTASTLLGCFEGLFLPGNKSNGQQLDGLDLVACFTLQKLACSIWGLTYHSEWSTTTDQHAAGLFVHVHLCFMDDWKPVKCMQITSCQWPSSPMYFMDTLSRSQKLVAFLVQWSPVPLIQIYFGNVWTSKLDSVFNVCAHVQCRWLH